MWPKFSSALSSGISYADAVLAPSGKFTALEASFDDAQPPSITNATAAESINLLIFNLTP